MGPNLHNRKPGTGSIFCRRHSRLTSFYYARLPEKKGEPNHQAVPFDTRRKAEKWLDATIKLTPEEQVLEVKRQLEAREKEMS